MPSDLVFWKKTEAQMMIREQMKGFEDSEQGIGGRFMMKTIIQIMLISMLVMLAAPSYSAQATQMWKCELDDEATEEDVQELVSAWLKAAKQLPGGEQLEAYVFMPVAAVPTGETDFFIISVSPSFADWGKFWDAYPDSPAADAEERAHEKFICPDSGLWESIQVQ